MGLPPHPSLGEPRPRPADEALHEPPCSMRVLPSDELLQGQTCVHIQHAGALYTLRATRSGKLILTK